MSMFEERYKDFTREELLGFIRECEDFFNVDPKVTDEYYDRYSVYGKLIKYAEQNNIQVSALFVEIRELKEEIGKLKNELSDEEQCRLAAQAYQKQAEDDVAALRARVEALEAALKPCVSLLDGLIAESKRSIDWGEEDSFRMGEWFEKEELESIEKARALIA